MEGFWTAKFKTPRGEGGGVAFFSAGKVYGGDGGYTYLGEITSDGTSVVANITVAPFVAGAPSVFGSIGKQFDLKITGSVSGDKLVGKGTSSLFPNIAFDVILLKVK